MNTNRTHRLRKSALALALGLSLAGSIHAQSNTTGSIAGTTTAGGTVVIENPATGFRREITAGADGSYRVGALPTGSYTVTAGGQSKTVNVTIGGTASGTTTLDVVQVQGSGVINAIDVASVESTTILTAEQIARIPVPRDITSVALLAPGTVKGDAAFGNLASFGGGAVSENQYFVNGFNISNSFKNLNFGQVPFEAIAEQQIKTGGYGAEFGRATGGVINLVTKRGSNEFHAGGNVFYTPDSLRGRNPDVYYNDPRYPDGKRLVSDNSKDSLGTTTSASVWASGALVEDRLFAYALLQYARQTDRDTYARIFDSQNSSISQKVPTWLVKLDWNISDSHLLELTAFSDTTKQESDIYSNVVASRSLSNLNAPVPYPPLTPATTDLPASLSTERTGYLGSIFDESGGESYSLKYTGYLTDNFTLSALYGHGESSRANYGVNAAGVELAYSGEIGAPVPGCPVISSTVEAAPVGCWFLVNANLGVKGAKDQRDQFRIDAEWALGDHLLRFGYDADDFTSVDGETTEGGAVWQYRTPIADASVATPGLVRRRNFQSGATVEINSEAFYIEDRWQVSPNFLAYMGLRWDSFENVNGAGDVFVEIKNQFGPRLGFAWDVTGDSRLKVYGNAGRYSLPLTANVAVRGASASLYAEQYFSFTGVDPVTGAPTGLDPNCAECGSRYLNNEFGLAKDAATIADQNLQPMYQDEYILGFQAQLTDHLSGGMRGIYRDLVAAIDDQCDYRPVLAWAEENGYDVSDPFSLPPATPDGAVHAFNPGFAFCHLYNPGRDALFQIDVDGDGDLEQVEIDAATLGPDAQRSYKAVEFFLEGSWDKFFMQASYTWSKSYGNTEGGVKSDIGQDDTGATQDFDYPELMIGALGYLPNDRRHAFKVFGSYQLSDEWSIGGNLLVQSGRPQSCFGFLGGSNTSGYQNGYFSCDTGRANLPGDGSGNNGTTVVPRGSVGRTDWTRTVDLNVAYRPGWADGHLTLKADVFNVFNEHAVTSVIEQGENTAGQPQPDRYLTPTSFQAPRSVRFMVQYDF